MVDLIDARPWTPERAADIRDRLSNAITAARVVGERPVIDLETADDVLDLVERAVAGLRS